MKKIMLQFHALPQEILDLVNEFKNETPCSFALIEANPFHLVLFNISDEFDLAVILKVLLSKRAVIALTNHQSLLPADSFNKFLDLNSEVVTIDVGRHSNGELCESGLSCIANSEEATEFANKIVKKLKKITHAGVLAVNPNSGIETILRTHRYTRGAKNLFDDGEKILPIAGNSIYRLDL